MEDNKSLIAYIVAGVGVGLCVIALCIHIFKDEGSDNTQYARGIQSIDDGSVPVNATPEQVDNTGQPISYSPVPTSSSTPSISTISPSGTPGVDNSLVSDTFDDLDDNNSSSGSTNINSSGSDGSSISTNTEKTSSSTTTTVSADNNSSDSNSSNSSSSTSSVNSNTSNVTTSSNSTSSSNSPSDGEATDSTPNTGYGSYSDEYTKRY